MNREAAPATPAAPAAPASVEARSVPAAVLAAMAESGPLFLPLRFLAEQSSLNARGGPLDSYPVFLAMFAAGVALATAGRRSRAFAPAVAGAAIAVGVVQARAFGSGHVGGVFIAVFMSLAVGVRVSTLAVRDWRDPVHVSFGVLTGVLLLEAVLAEGAGWGALLAVVIPVFFLASLASRSASLRIGDAEGLQAGGAGAPRQWGRIVAVMALGGLALLGLAALLGDQAHALERLGRFIPLGLYGVIYGATVVASAVLRPIGWVLSKLGFHVGAIQQLLRHLPRFRHRAGRALTQHGPTGASLRMVGLLALAGIAALLVWVIARQRRAWMLRDRADPEAPAEPSRPLAVASEPRRRKRRPRGELPEDSVRRLYAETLLSLESWGAVRPRHRTPGEYLREVVRALPASAPGFTALTRAYEDVRYGSRAFDRQAVDVLEVHRDSVLDALRRAPPPERPS